MILVADHHDIQIGRNPAFEMLGEGDTGKPTTDDDDPPHRTSSMHTCQRLFRLPGPRRCLPWFWGACVTRPGLDICEGHTGLNPCCL
jgi:hypothetical protein